MNCFEARNSFASFWRKALDSESRETLLVHLKQCAGCDRAFRVFALTAPLLYSTAVPAQRATAAEWREPSRVAGPSRRRVYTPGGANSRHDSGRPRWRALAAMLAMIAAAGFAAYLSAAEPRETLDEALTNPEPTGELLAQDIVPVSLNDIAR